MEKNLEDLKAQILPTFVENISTRTVHRCAAPGFTACSFSWTSRAIAVTRAAKGRANFKLCKTCNVTSEELCAFLDSL